MVACEFNAQVRRMSWAKAQLDGVYFFFLHQTHQTSEHDLTCPTNTLNLAVNLFNNFTAH